MDRREKMVRFLHGREGRVYILPKINCSIPVRVEGSEYMFRKFAGIAIREKIAINFLELFNGKMARGTILQEAFVPFLDLFLSEFCMVSQIIQCLGLQFTILFAHFLLRRGKDR